MTYLALRVIRLRRCCVSTGGNCSSERRTYYATGCRCRFLIQRVAEGCKNREIADSLGTTEHVVKNYLRRIYDKLGLWNRVELALWYEARQNEQVYHA